MDIATWLRNLGLERYEPAFRDNEITTEVLPDLSDTDLRELGLPLGPRKAVLRALGALRSSEVRADAGLEPADLSPEEPPLARHQAERRQLTVMFVDLVGSTALSTNLDPEDMREVLRAYQSTVTREIGRMGGHVAKLMGDGILAYFGWPRAHEDDAESAVQAGLAIAKAVNGLSTPAGDLLRTRVGIATGLVVVGDLIGEGMAREEAVVGDTPNLAARLQATAEPDAVMIADGTRRLLGELFELKDLGARDLKGFERPVSSY